MITHYFRTLKDHELKVYPAPRAGVWTHVVTPTEEELIQVVNDFGLEESIVEDANDFFEVPRLEHTASVVYFFTRYPFRSGEVGVDTAPLLFVIGETFVLTIAQKDVPFFARFTSGTKPIVTTQKTNLFIKLMGALTEAYERELTAIRKSVSRDRKQLRSIHARDIQRLVSYEEELNDIISAIMPTNSWLQHLMKGKYLQMFEDDMELMEDLLIDNNQVADSAKAILKTIQNIRNAAESILTQNLNSTIRVLTALTVLLTIPTLVSSLYGMNVDLPLQHAPYAFWSVIGLIVVIVGIVTYFFVNKRWF